ncbi:MAG: PEGA domain-containing protein [Alphaproteobacteria bacterium]|nr:PEGA domain-containing protein [Alphaproteobacteria bacterium]
MRIIKWLSFVFLLLLSTWHIKAQTLTFKDDFRLLPNDLDAKVHYPQIDNNGQKMALIKITNPNKGFHFDVGSIGQAIVDENKRPGEIWVYVPPGAKHIKINHANLGVLQDYVFPVDIEEARVYTVTLISGTQTTKIKEESTKGIINIITNPANAKVYFNNILQTQATPVYNLKIEPGVYKIKITAPLHRDFDTAITMTVNGKAKIDKNLIPKYGTLTINTNPVSNVKVIIDPNSDAPQECLSPCTIEKLASGKHSLTLIKDLYQPIENYEVTIRDQDKKIETIKLTANYGTLKIVTDPENDVLIDDVAVGKGDVEKQLIPQNYHVVVKRPKYETFSQNIAVGLNKMKVETIVLKPITGTLEIKTIPDECDIYIDDVKYKEQSPVIIKDMIIGQHKIVLKKPNFTDVTKIINIVEDKTEDVDITLEERKQIKLNISCYNNFKASVYLNKEYIGTTPITNKLYPKGTYSLVVSAHDYDDYTETVTLKNETETFTDLLKKSIIAHEKEKKFEHYYSKRNYWGLKLGQTYSNTQLLFKEPNLLLNPNGSYIVPNDRTIQQPEPKFGTMAGVYYELFSNSRKVSYQIEAQYTRMGSNYANSALNLDFLRIPVTLKWYPLNTLHGHKNKERNLWSVNFIVAYDVLISATLGTTDKTSVFSENSISYGIGTDLKIAKGLYIGGNFNYVQNTTMLINDDLNENIPTVRNFYYPMAQLYLEYKF